MKGQPIRRWLKAATSYLKDRFIKAPLPPALGVRPEDVPLPEFPDHTPRTFVQAYFQWCRAYNPIGKPKSGSFTKSGPGRRHRQGKGRKYSKVQRILYGQSVL